MSLKRAAEVLGTSVTAIKLRTHRAYQALRAVLREERCSVSAELKAWVLARRRRNLRHARRGQPANVLFGMLAAASGVGAFVIYALITSEGQLVRLGGEVASHRYLERSVWLVLTTAGGALGVAATALWFALCRGRSMLGRSPAGSSSESR